MKNIFKSYLFETKKLIYNKRLCVIIIIALGLILFGLVTISQDLYLVNSVTDKEVAVSDYARLRDSNKLYYDIICGNDVNIPEGVILLPYNEIDKDYYYQQYLKYDYLLNTNTFERDYVEKDLNDTVKGHEDAVSMLKLADYAFYFLMLVAILFPLLIISLEFDKGKLKNSLVAPVTRKELLIGKMLFVFSYLLILLVVIFVLGVSLNGGSADKILVYTGQQVKAVKCIVFFVSKMLNMFFLMLFVSSASLFFAEKTKKAFIGAFSVIAFYFLSLGSYTVVYNALNRARPLDKNILQQFFPIINLQTQQSDFSSPNYWIILAAYFVVTAVLACFSWISLKKRNVL